MRAFLILLTFATACGGAGWHSDVATTMGTLKWRHGNNESCTGRDCCISGDTDGTCVLPEALTVLSPDGASLEVVRYATANHRSTWGLASERGEIIVAPKHDDVMALSSVALVSQRGEVFDRSGTHALGLRDAPVFVPYSFPVHFIVKKEYPDGRLDVAPLHPDGTLGAIVEGVIPPTKEQIGFVVAPFVILATGPSMTQPHASVLFDVTGHVAWAGPEVRVHGVPNGKRESGADVDDPRRAVASLRIGPAPIDVDLHDHGMYIPLDPKTLQPWPLPPDALGVVPIRVWPATRSRPEEPLDPDMVLGWVLVSKRGGKLEYRIGGGHDLDAMETFAPDALAKMAVLDAVQLVPSGEGMLPRVVGHRAAQRDWVSYEGRAMFDHTWVPTETALTADDPGFRTPSEAAIGRRAQVSKAQDDEIAHRKEREAYDQANRQASLQAAAETRATQVAAWEAESKTRAKHTWDNRSDCVGVDDSPACRYVFNAALILGPTQVAEFFALHGVAGHVDAWLEACDTGQVSATICERVHAIAEREYAAEQRNEAAAEADRARWAAHAQAARDAAAAGPSVNVQTYEGGRLTTKTMSLDRYHQIYGR